MKMTVTLDVEEVKIAIKDYLFRQGFNNVENIILKAGQNYDPFDRPFGVGFQNATAEVEK